MMGFLHDLLHFRQRNIAEVLEVFLRDPVSLAYSATSFGPGTGHRAPAMTLWAMDVAAGSRS